MTKVILWGLAASPYQLKDAVTDWTSPDTFGCAGRSRRGVWRRLSMAVRLDDREASARNGLCAIPRWHLQFDEYPGGAVLLSGWPHAFTMIRRRWRATWTSIRSRHSQFLCFPSDPQLAFICELIDEAFDEFGLYMVHHMRWVGSAHGPRPMGEMTARELGPLLPPGVAPLVAGHLYRRQASGAAPTLFSVAPDGFDAGVSRARTPPARAGFPPTHALLDKAWRAYLAAMEELLAAQPFLLGERFTLADASAYGQLAMNLVDPEAAALLEELAPRTYRWLCAIRDGEHSARRGDLALTPALQPLLRMISQTFVAADGAERGRLRARALAAGETLVQRGGLQASIARIVRRRAAGLSVSGRW